jgi:hypothetical protein
MMQDANAKEDLRSFARLVDVLAPWLDQVVIVGGWRIVYTGFTLWRSRSNMSLWQPY